MLLQPRIEVITTITSTISITTTIGISLISTVMIVSNKVITIRVRVLIKGVFIIAKETSGPETNLPCLPPLTREGGLGNR